MPFFAVSSKKVQLLPHHLCGYWTDRIDLAHDVATVLPLNISESELPYSNPFENASLLNKSQFANFAKKIGCHGNVP